MSQSTEKRARRAWRNRMEATAGSDWKLFMEKTERKLKRYKWATIILSILSAVLMAIIIYGVYYEY